MDQAQHGPTPSLRFDNHFVRAMPADSERANHVRAVKDVLYSFVAPTPVKDPRVFAWSEAAASLLDLGGLSAANGWEAQVFSGNRLLPGMEPVATRYGGHQFGHWADQLGDGRAISLGEVLNQAGERWEIQLKGAGPTPYSRGADGRAVLRSTLREFLCSEAMFHLGVPTTRALCALTTGEDVVRDMLYDGNARPEPGAIVARLSPSFLRFGHFEILAAHGETELLRRLAEDTVRTHFPELGEPSEEVFAAWFTDICERTARLMVEWFRVGFVHGVMNTDNMSILGLTIDYGPYGWMDAYDPDFTPNTTDFRHRRYRFTHQPAVAQWNLERLAQALSPLFRGTAALEAGLETYQEAFNLGFRRMSADKLGLKALETDADLDFLGALHGVLAMTGVDMTVFHRRLADLHGLSAKDRKSDEAKLNVLRASFYREPEGRARDALLAWLNDYLARTETEGRSASELKTAMDRVNPLFIPRNYLSFGAIEAFGRGEDGPLRDLMTAMKTPYTENEATRPFAGRAPDWAARTVGCSALSCSS